jgi:hypothetical protein
MDLVVIVGSVDNVDKHTRAELWPYIQWTQARSSAYVRVRALKLSGRRCGESSDKVGAKFGLFDPFHIWRRVKRLAQIWGRHLAAFLSFLEQVSDFSTVESSYPQFSATYPQAAHRTPLWPTFVNP